MSKFIRLDDHYLASRRQYIEVYRLNSATPQGLTVTAASGTIALADQRGAGLTLTNQAATDNALSSVLSAQKLAIIAADKPLHFMADVKYSEANTNAANLYIGMTSTTATLTITDNGLGPAVSYSGLGFYKVDGGVTNWSIVASNAATQTKVELTVANTVNRTAYAAASTNFATFEIEVYLKTATLADVIFKINDATVYKITDWVYTSIAAMSLAAICKNGSTTAESWNIRQLGFASIL